MPDSWTEIDGVTLSWASLNTARWQLHAKAVLLALKERCENYPDDGTKIANWIANLQPWHDIIMTLRRETYVEEVVPIVNGLVSSLCPNDGFYIDHFDKSADWHDDDRGWDWGPKPYEYFYVWMDSQVYPYGRPSQGADGEDRPSIVDRIGDAARYSAITTMKAGAQDAILQEWLLQQYRLINALKLLKLGNSGATYQGGWTGGTFSGWSLETNQYYQDPDATYGGSLNNGSRRYTDVKCTLDTASSLSASADLYVLLDSVPETNSWAEVKSGAPTSGRCWKKIVANVALTMDGGQQTILDGLGKIESCPTNGNSWAMNQQSIVVLPDFAFKNW
jgi:hypothetical protein